MNPVWISILSLKTIVRYKLVRTPLGWLQLQYWLVSARFPNFLTGTESVNSIQNPIRVVMQQLTVVGFKSLSIGELTVLAVVRWSWLGVTVVMVVQRPLLYEIQYNTSLAASWQSLRRLHLLQTKHFSSVYFITEADIQYTLHTQAILCIQVAIKMY